jgi:hypothetical protein
MSLGGKARPMGQAAPRTPEASEQNAGARDTAIRAQVRAHVRQVLTQAGSRSSSERN